MGWSAPQGRDNEPLHQGSQQQGQQHLK